MQCQAEISFWPVSHQALRRTPDGRPIYHQALFLLIVGKSEPKTGGWDKTAGRRVLTPPILAFNLNVRGNIIQELWPPHSQEPLA